MADRYLEVTRQPDALKLEPGGSGTLTYLVTNLTGQDDHVRVKRPSLPSGSPLALEVQGEEQRQLSDGGTVTFSLKVGVSQSARPGEHPVTLAFIASLMEDKAFSAPVASVMITDPKPVGVEPKRETKSKWTWWLALAAGVAVLLVVTVVAIWRQPQDTGEECKAISDCAGGNTCMTRDGQKPSSENPSLCLKTAGQECQNDQECEHGHCGDIRGASGEPRRECSSRLPDEGNSMSGGSADHAAASCEALRAAGVTQSATYWVKNPASADPEQSNKPVLVYCDQITNGGGWALVYNSVIGVNTLDFWYIAHAQRASRRGQPSLATNFYDGSLYQVAAATYMDVIEDLRGAEAIALVASSTRIDNLNMRFVAPKKLSGQDGIYENQFATGWSAPDYDGDTNPVNCANVYGGGITQHYGSCWNYNLGGDADGSGGDLTDGRVGPHLYQGIAKALGLFTDGSDYTRVRRISRWVKW